MIFFSGLIGSSSFEALRLFPSLTVLEHSVWGGIVKVALPSGKTLSTESAGSVEVDAEALRSQSLS